MEPTGLVTDQPDLLSRRDLVDRFTHAVVSEIATQERSRTVALVGSWGSGKSWILDQVRPSLGGVTRDFNPWLFSDELGLFRGFSALLLERIKDKRARKRIAKILDVVGPSIKGFGFDASGSISAISKIAIGAGSPESIRNAIVKAVGLDSRPTYIILDDLDRLTPTELLIVFKLLRLVGDLPQLVYVLAYDEQTLLRLMMRTEIAHNSMELARTYLDKIVEVKVPMPPISDRKKAELVLDPIVEFGSTAQRHFSAQDDEEIRWKVESLLYPRLSTMRLFERYMSAVMALPPRLFGEIRYLDWILISFLRTAEPHAVYVIQKYPSVFLGVSRDFGLGNAKTAESARRVASELVAEASSESHATEIFDLVDSLFPRFAAHREGAESRVGADLDQRISSPEYFALYFEHGLPEGRVSDVAVEIALAELGNVTNGAGNSKGLTELLAADPHGVLLAVDRRWSRVTTAAPLFYFLTTVWDSPILDYSTGVFGFRGQSEVRLLAEQLLRSFTETELEHLGDSLKSEDSPRSLLVTVISRMGLAAGSSYYVDWVRRTKVALSNLAAMRVSAAITPLREKPEITEFFGILRHLDKAHALKVAREALESSNLTHGEVLGWYLRYHTEFGGKISAIRVADEALRDERLVVLITTPPAGPYPSEWDVDGRLIAALNNASPPENETVANYLIADWPARVKAHSADDDDGDE